ncbi:MAG: hypothetical protein IT443_09730 [Phycisphaeraceae bacterium]|nr:hypothetical protein [Phycisphaeraceae bacterium]
MSPKTNTIRTHRADQDMHRRTEARHLLARAELSYEAGLLSEASEMARRAATMVPRMAEARLMQARTVVETLRRRQLDLTLDSDGMVKSDDPQEIFQNVRALHQHKQFSLAYAALERAIAENLQPRLAHQMAAAIALSENQSELACEHLAEVLKLEPNHRAARRVLARLLSSSQPSRAAELILAEETGKSPTEMRFWASRLLIKAGDLTRARQLLAALLDELPGDPTVRGALSEISRQEQLENQPIPMIVSTAPKATPATSAASSSDNDLNQSKAA